ncbi:hypothetical protein GALL_455040 [mine drainage metagenome]|uniref:Uncharacterized protein n=1 Tax=mine drainage metagenome TaxID=410659 RepID=A0A1J5PNX4_9ZZZZ
MGLNFTITLQLGEPANFPLVYRNDGGNSWGC